MAGIYLAQTGGWPIIGIGLLSIMCGYAYSSGPLPISHTPLGEIFVITFFGIIAVGGTYYLQIGTINVNVVLAGFVIGCFSAAVLMVNNMRDRKEDRESGRRTLAILAGSQISRTIYGFLVLAPFVIQYAIEQSATGAGNWLPLLPLPFGVFLVWRFRQAESGFAYNALLEQTAKLQVVFSLLFFLGLLALKLEQSA
jgi:1,4-dihydroxy-2-naphthoate octaprenyltransferase